MSAVGGYQHDLVDPALATCPSASRGLDGGCVKLPDVTPVSAEALAAIAARHGLRFDRAELLVPAGIMNTVYAVSGEHVLRVPRAHAAHVKDALREAAAIPVARSAGVRTPGLVAFDDACDILPVPYLVTERVDGVNLESLGISPPDPRQAWVDLAGISPACMPARGKDLLRLWSPGLTNSGVIRELWLRAGPRMVGSRHTRRPGC